MRTRDGYADYENFGRLNVLDLQVLCLQCTPERLTYRNMCLLPIKPYSEPKFGGSFPLDSFPLLALTHHSYLNVIAMPND